MDTNEIASTLRLLGIPPEEALVVGGTVLALLDIRQAADIDVMIPRSKFEELAQKHNTASIYPDGSGCLRLGNVELMYEWYGKTITDFLPRAIKIGSLNLMSLNDLRAWKQMQDRPKDRRDIKLIDEYLKSHQKTT